MLVLAAMVMILNETSLSVALPAIMADFGLPASVVQWLLTGFMLTMAVVIPTTGYLIDRFHTRQIFFTAATLFIIGSVISAFAPAFVFLLLGRIIQAIGTALVLPLLMTVTMTLVPPARRGSVMGVISIVISVAPALGPTVGGAVLNALSWHWIFGVMVPLMIAIFVWGVISLSNVGEDRITPLDFFSVILSALAFGGLVFGLSSAEKIIEGRGTLELVAGIVGAVCLVVFTLRQVRLSKDNRALLDLRPFKVRNYWLCIIILLISFGNLIGSVTVLPLYLQNALGVSALVTGLVLMPGGLAQGLLSPIIGRLFDSYGPRPLMLPGAILVAGALWAMSTLSAQSPIWMVIAMYLVFGAGFSLIMTPLMTTALSSLPGKLYGHGSAILNTLQQLAGAAGTAFLIVFFTRGFQVGSADGLAEADATSQGTSWAFIFAGVLAIVVVILSPFITRVSGHDHGGGHDHTA